MMKRLFILSFVMLLAGIFIACNENDELKAQQEHSPIVVCAGICNDEAERF